MLSPNFDKLFCHTHSHGARVVIITAFSKAEWDNASAVEAFVQHEVRHIMPLYRIDGFNNDIEDVLNNASEAAQLVNLSRRLTEVAHAVQPGSQITFAVDSLGSKRNIDMRQHWPMATLAKAVDLLIVMAYDMFNVHKPARAPYPPDPPGPFTQAKMPLPFLKASVAEFVRRGVPASSLVLAMPFFGSDFLCSSNSSDCKVVDAWNGGLSLGLSPGAHHVPTPRLRHASSVVLKREARCPTLAIYGSRTLTCVVRRSRVCYHMPSKKMSNGIHILQRRFSSSRWTTQTVPCTVSPSRTFVRWRSSTPSRRKPRWAASDVGRQICSITPMRTVLLESDVASNAGVHGLICKT